MTDDTARLPALQRIDDRLAAIDGGEEHVFSQIAEATPMHAIARALGTSRTSLYRWCEATPERQAKFAAAQRESADVLAENAGYVLDALAEQPDLTAAEVSLADKRAAHRRWLASVRNRERYGEQKGQVQVQVSFGDLFREALELVAQEAPPELPAGPVVEAELIEDEES